MGRTCARDIDIGSARTLCSDAIWINDHDVVEFQTLGLGNGQQGDGQIQAFLPGADSRIALGKLVGPLCFSVRIDNRCSTFIGLKERLDC